MASPTRRGLKRFLLRLFGLLCQGGNGLPDEKGIETMVALHAAEDPVLVGMASPTRRGLKPLTSL